MVDYTLTVTNSGPEVATNVRVLELVPYGTTVVSITANNPDFTGEYCSLGGSCYLGSMYMTTVATIHVTLKVNADYQGSTVVNTAQVSADQADTDPADNIASATTNVTRSADLSVDKKDLSDPVNAGGILLYQLIVSNSGPSDAQNVQVKDTLPVGVSFVDASPGCTESGGLVTCNLGTLGAGDTVSLLIQVKVNGGLPDGTQITNQAQVLSTTGDPASGNNTDSEVTTVKQSPLNPTDLQITKTATPNPVIASQNLTYTLQVKNNGPAPATSVIVVDALPSGVTFVSATATQGVCNSGVTCSLGDMAVGATAPLPSW